ncbi:MAG: DUF6498-containing protein [Permianibacter sp.]
MSQQEGSRADALIAMVLVVVSNAVAQYAVWHEAWTAGQVLELFWYENLVLGLVYVVRLLALPGPPTLHAMKWFIVPFFCLHYGAFIAIHGFFVFSDFFATSPVPEDATGFRWALLSAVAWLLWQGWQTHHAYQMPVIAAREPGVTPDAVTARADVLPLMRVMTEPYFRMAVLHLTLVLGGVLAGVAGSPWAAVALLLLLKLGYELALASGWLARRFFSQLK